tara:strand:+ start:664 stop:1077 length:414 start_codon:yes stop_codon:yes gene_type:complete
MNRRFRYEDGEGEFREGRFYSHESIAVREWCEQNEDRELCFPLCDQCVIHHGHRLPKMLKDMWQAPLFFDATDCDWKNTPTGILVFDYSRPLYWTNVEVDGPEFCSYCDCTLLSDEDWEYNRVVPSRLIGLGLRTHK